MVDLINFASLTGSGDHNCTVTTTPATRRSTRATRPTRSNSGRPSPCVVLQLGANDLGRQAATANDDATVPAYWTETSTVKLSTTIAARRPTQFVIVVSSIILYTQ